MDDDRPCCAPRRRPRVQPVSDSAPIHLQPTAPLAERVLLPGDPGRALALAQSLLVDPLMFNHNRGLWGYTGAAPDGELLTIQATGMGGPSAAIVLSELIELGARRAIRVGWSPAHAPSSDRVGQGEREDKNDRCEEVAKKRPIQNVADKQGCQSEVCKRNKERASEGLARYTPDRVALTNSER